MRFSLEVPELELCGLFPEEGKGGVLDYAKSGESRGSRTRKRANLVLTMSTADVKIIETTSKVETSSLLQDNDKHTNTHNEPTVFLHPGGVPPVVLDSYTKTHAHELTNPELNKILPYNDPEVVKSQFDAEPRCVCLSVSVYLFHTFTLSH